MISNCNCQNIFMDNRYGKGKRVMNKCKPKNQGEIRLRCASCGKEKVI